MKSFKVILATMLTLLLTASTVHAANFKNLKVVNLSGFDISELYLTSADNKDFGKNLLNETLNHRDATAISYNQNFSYCKLRVNFTNGSNTAWDKINFQMKPSILIIHYDPFEKSLAYTAYE